MSSSLVVQAHPVPDSFNAAVLERVQRGLAAGGTDPAVARLGAGERPTRDDVAAADHLALVYPTWWGGQPAMLLDWLHEMVLDSDEPLAGIESVSAVTSCGGSTLTNNVQGQWGKRWLDRHLIPACSPTASLDWVPIYKMDRLTPERATGFLDDVERHFGPTDDAPFSPSPSAAAFGRLRGLATRWV